MIDPIEIDRAALTINRRIAPLTPSVSLEVIFMPRGANVLFVEGMPNYLPPKVAPESPWPPIRRAIEAAAADLGYAVETVALDRRPGWAFRLTPETAHPTSGTATKGV